MATVRAVETVSVAWSQGKSYLRKGQDWDSAHPLVQERPDLFTDGAADETVVGRGARRVENTYRAPGGKRRGKRGGGN